MLSHQLVTVFNLPTGMLGRLCFLPAPSLLVVPLLVSVVQVVKLGSKNVF